MPESSETQQWPWGEPAPTREEVAKETKNLVERIGEKKVRALAALGLAAAGFLGISGKPNSYAGVGISLPDQTTGERTAVGVAASSIEDEKIRGIGVRESESGLGYQKFTDVFKVIIGGATFRIYVAKSTRTETGERPADRSIDLIRIEAGRVLSPPRVSG